MSNTTKIQWADATFNPWIGCTKVSAGCKNCYAENTTRARVLRGQGHETWGKGAQRSRTSTATWKAPLRWESECAIHPGYPHRVFPSLCDWLDDEVPIEWLADFLKLIHDTPNLTWLLLTKRPENYFRRIDCALAEFGKLEDCELVNSWSDPDEQLTLCPRNVWIGTSVEDQVNADKRIPQLLQIPAKVRFLSVEPLIGPINLLDSGCGGAFRIPGTKETGPCGQGVDWVIFGGESGPKARPCDMQWIGHGVKQCQTAGVAAFVKQLGSNPMWVEQRGPHYKTVHQPHFKDKKGGDPAEWPEDLRIREFPPGL